VQLVAGGAAVVLTGRRLPFLVEFDRESSTERKQLTLSQILRHVKFKGAQTSVS
jgi:hypothetical protein